MGRNAGVSPPVGWISVRDYALETMRRSTTGQSFQLIVHLAAAGVHPSDRDPSALVEGNACAAVDVVRLAAEVSARAVIVAGSSAEYSPYRDGLLDETVALESTALYGATKAAGGLMALAMARALGMPCAVLRLFNVFGPGEAPHRLLPSLHAALRVGRSVELSTGTQIRDFIHVDDVCQAIVACLGPLSEGQLATGAYNISTGIGHTVRQFAEAVCDAMGSPRELLAFGALAMRPDDRPVVVGDASAYRAATGWAPALQLPEAVARSIVELEHDAIDENKP